VRRWPASCMSATVCPERCGMSDLQIQEIRPRHAAAARSSVVVNPGTNHVSVGGTGVRQNELAPQYLADDLHRRRLRSAATAALIGPATARFTIGDRPFSVAAARAWNSLPLSVTSSASLPVSRKHFYLLAPSHHSNTCLRFILPPCFILRFLHVSYKVFLSCFMYLQSPDITPR
jgi:hypothetical protein